MDAQREELWMVLETGIWTEQHSEARLPLDQTLERNIFQDARFFVAQKFRVGITVRVHGDSIR